MVCRARHVAGQALHGDQLVGLASQQGQLGYCLLVILSSFILYSIINTGKSIMVLTCNKFKSLSTFRPGLPFYHGLGKAGC